MNRNIEVLKHCSHFYTIINFEYYSDDIVSEKLIDIYEKFIFSADISLIENVNKIEKLDKILYKYINDYCFREQVKQDIMSVKVQRGENILDTIVSTIINLFDNYESMLTRRVQMTRWI